MGYGLPIVAAGTAINKEICGEGALYYPPLDFQAGAEAVKEALKPEILKKLIESGTKRVGSFDWSWKRYATEFIDIIEKVGESKCRA
jgi:glycosyltransferase involved in cell wall biosynthesis